MDSPIARRTFIAGTAAALAAPWQHVGGEPGAGPARADVGAGPPHRFAWRGVNYDTDREVWRPAFVRHEIATIADELHCNAVFLLGSDLDRLIESAVIAADHGLYVWFEPRAFDSNAADTLAYVSDVARAAQVLRAGHPDVGLSVGVELTIFMAGIVPGRDWSERATALGTVDPAIWTTRLNEVLTDAVTTVRPLFDGLITYSAGTWEDVDWTNFDVVGMDLYRDEHNETTFVDDVRALRRHGKPVVITEFGCCAFRGAEDLGGGGFMVVDYTQAVPRVPDWVVRDESVQATYIEELLDVFETERVEGAFVYNFIMPDSPYSPDPAYDYDKVTFGIVTCFPPGSVRAYDATGQFEPKQAFTAIARRFDECV